ncbi:hypothetical protein HK405_003123 [Cladochytrium tenue]|nr:hypothetical protein HK405_003123 [Cladochytrium tenue]
MGVVGPHTAAPTAAVTTTATTAASTGAQTIWAHGGAISRLPARISNKSVGNASKGRNGHGSGGGGGTAAGLRRPRRLAGLDLRPSNWVAKEAGDNGDEAAIYVARAPPASQTRLFLTPPVGAPTSQPPPPPPSLLHRRPRPLPPTSPSPDSAVACTVPHHWPDVSAVAALENSRSDSELPWRRELIKFTALHKLHHAGAVHSVAAPTPAQKAAPVAVLLLACADPACEPVAVPADVATRSPTLAHIARASRPFQEGRTGVIRLSCGEQVLSQTLLFLFTSWIRAHIDPDYPPFAPALPPLLDLLHFAIYLDLPGLAAVCMQTAADHFADITSFANVAPPILRKLFGLLDLRSLAAGEAAIITAAGTSDFAVRPQLSNTDLARSWTSLLLRLENNDPRTFIDALATVASDPADADLSPDNHTSNSPTHPTAGHADAGDSRPLLHAAKHAALSRHLLVDHEAPRTSLVACLAILADADPAASLGALHVDPLTLQSWPLDHIAHLLVALPRLRRLRVCWRAAAQDSLPPPHADAAARAAAALVVLFDGPICELHVCVAASTALDQPASSLERDIVRCCEAIATVASVAALSPAPRAAGQPQPLTCSRTLAVSISTAPSGRVGCPPRALRDLFARLQPPASSSGSTDSARRAISSVHIAGVPLPPSAVVPLLRGLPATPSTYAFTALAELSLPRCDLSAATIVAIAAALLGSASASSSASSSTSSLLSTSASAAASSTAASPRLRALDLAGNVRRSDPAAAQAGLALARWIAAPSCRLRRLDLSANYFSSAGCLALADAAAACCSLEHLALGRMPDLAFALPRLVPVTSCHEPRAPPVPACSSPRSSPCSPPLLPPQLPLPLPPVSNPATCNTPPTRRRLHTLLLPHSCAPAAAAHAAAVATLLAALAHVPATASTMSSPAAPPLPNLTRLDLSVAPLPPDAPALLARLLIGPAARLEELVLVGPVGSPPAAATRDSGGLDDDDADDEVNCIVGVEHNHPHHHVLGDRGCAALVAATLAGLAAGQERHQQQQEQKPHLRLRRLDLSRQRLTAAAAEPLARLLHASPRLREFGLRHNPRLAAALAAANTAAAGETAVGATVATATAAAAASAALHGMRAAAAAMPARAPLAVDLRCRAATAAAADAGLHDNDCLDGSGGDGHVPHRTPAAAASASGAVVVALTPLGNKLMFFDPALK